MKQFFKNIKLLIGEWLVSVALDYFGWELPFVVPTIPPEAPNPVNYLQKRVDYEPLIAEFTTRYAMTDEKAKFEIARTYANSKLFQKSIEIRTQRRADGQTTYIGRIVVLNPSQIN